MIVVADTTPLLYLSRVRRLEVIRAVHGEVIAAARSLRDAIDELTKSGFRVSPHLVMEALRQVGEE